MTDSPPLVIRWGQYPAAAGAPEADRAWTDLAPDRRAADWLQILERLAALPAEQPVLLVRADVIVPAEGLERLLAALGNLGDAILSPLDNLDRAHSPLPSGNDIPAPLDVAGIDRLCAWLGGRFLTPCRTLPIGATLWPTGAARRLLDSGWTPGQDLPGQTAFLCDHIFAAVPGRDLDGPEHWSSREVPTPATMLDAMRVRWRLPKPGDFDARRPVADIAAPPGPVPGTANSPTVLHICHSWGGGSERFIRDLATADDGRCHLLLTAHGCTPRKTFGEWLELRPAADPTLLLGRYPMSPPIADTSVEHPLHAQLLQQLIEQWSVDAIIVSSVIGHGLGALRTGLPTVVVCHDYYPLWPELHRDFGDEARRFDRDELEHDLAGGPLTLFANHSADRWWTLREAYVAALLERRLPLVTPTRQVRENILRMAPALAGADWQVVPHGIEPWPEGTPTSGRIPERDRLRVLVPGRIGGGKGLALVSSVMNQLDDRFEFVFLGAGDAGTALHGRQRAHVIHDYKREDLPGWIERLAPDLALLPATVAETFGYLLSELQSLGMPVLATAIGSYGERVREGLDGFLVTPSADDIAARLDHWHDNRAELAAVRSFLASHPARSTRDMAADYRTLLPLDDVGTRNGHVRLPTPDDMHTAWLTRQQLETEHHRNRLHTMLKEGSAEQDRRAAWGFQLQEQLDERTRWALSMQDELAKLHSNPLWRLVTSKRSPIARLEAIRQRLFFRLSRARNLARRVRISLATRGIGGTYQRWRARRRNIAPGRQWLAPIPTSRQPPARLPTSSTPVVSIVIPIHGKLAYTVACLESIVEHAGPTPFEVIVVDDVSPDGSADALATVEGLNLLRNAENLGFVGSCNAGAAAAKGRWLVFLNNDTTVTAGWLDALLATFEDFDGAGLVGSRLVYPDGRLQEAGGLVFSDGSGWNYGRFDNPADPRFGYARETDYCSGAAIAIERDLFDRLGRFDPRYAPAYYEDTDLAFKVREAGLKVICQPASTVIHHEGVTSGTDTSSGIKRYQVVNQATFTERWHEALRRQPAPGTDVERIVRDRPNGRVLVVDATTPEPDKDSGSVRLTHVLRLLRESGRHVTFFADNRAYVPGYTERLQKRGIEVLHHPWLTDPIVWLRQHGADLDAVIVCRHYIASSYVDAIRRYAPRARFIFDTVDLHYLREERAAALGGSEDLARQAAKTRMQELRVINAADVTLVVSPAEKGLLAADAPDARVEVLSNVHDVRGCRRDFAERRDLLFIGGFQHPPNIDAVTWFVHDVFPHVRAALPDVRFHVIGSRMPPAIRDLAVDGVDIHGHVDDLEPFLDGCRVALAPLRYGAGVKGKVNMSMSFGQPVVATTMAVEGMHLIAAEEVLVADTAEEFAARVIRLYGDEVLWRRLSAAGLSNVHRHFSFDAARAALTRIFAGHT